MKKDNKIYLNSTLDFLPNHTFHRIKTVYMYNDVEKTIVCEMGESLQAVL